MAKKGKGKAGRGRGRERKQRGRDHGGAKEHGAGAWADKKVKKAIEHGRGKIVEVQYARRQGRTHKYD